MQQKDHQKCHRCGSPRPSDNGPNGAENCPGCLLAVMDADPTPCGWTFNGPSDSAYPKRLGDYQLIREIARGGMGIVWLARQTSLNREVALKILPPIFAADPVRIARFQSEASLAARLRHPNIVAVHEIGDLEGVVFYSMDYVQGQDLSKKAAARRLRPRQVMELVKAVAEAVHYAHESGVLHRDLKPSNILIDESGRPWIVDFGLARLIGQDSNITQTGEIVGSPAYIPPEHITTSDALPTVQADVYGLGVLLYYCLTQRAPYVADTVSATLRKVLTTNPLSIRSVRSDIPDDLEYIANRCLAKDPGGRYPTAGDVAADLALVLSDKPLPKPKEVIPPEPPKRVISRRLIVGVVAVAIPVVVGISGWGSFKGALLRETYLQKVAERIRQERIDHYVDEVGRADRALGMKDSRTAASLLEGLEEMPETKDLLGLEWFWLRSLLAESDEQKTWRVGEPLLSFLPLTEKGSFALASANGISLVSANAPGSGPFRQLWGPVEGRTIERDSTAQSLWVGDDLGLHRVDMKSGRFSTFLSDSISRVRRSPSGNRLAAVMGPDDPANPLSNVVVFDAMTARPLSQFPCEPNTELAFLTDDTLEGLGPTGQRWRWQVGQRRAQGIRIPESSGVVSFAATPNLERFAQIDDCSILRIQRRRGSLVELEEEVLFDSTSRLAFSDRGDALVHASPATGKAWIRSAPDWRVQATLDQIPAGLVDLHISSTPSTVFLASRDGSFQRRTWRALESRSLILSDPQASGLTEAITSPDGRWFAIGCGPSHEPWTWVRDLSGDNRSLIHIPGRPMAFSPSEEQILQSHGDGRISLWDLKDCKLLAEFRTGIRSRDLSERISSDGSMMVVLDSESRVRVVHLMTGLEIRGPKGRILDLRISPDGRRLAFLTAGGAGIYDFGSGDQWHYAEGTYTAMEFSPDGRCVALGNEVGVVNLYDAVNRVSLIEREVQSSPILTMAFLADGRTLATGGGTNGVHLWSAPDLRELTRIPVSGSVCWLGARVGHTALLVWTDEGVRIISAPNPHVTPPPPVRSEGGFWEDPVSVSTRLSKSPFRDPVAIQSSLGSQSSKRTP